MQKLILILVCFILCSCGSSSDDVSNPDQSDTTTTESIYFVGTSNSIWATDGTAGETYLVAEFSVSANCSYPRDIVPYGDSFFFNGRYNHRQELCFSDGTQAGTRLVKDIGETWPGDPRFKMVVGNTLFFSADDNEHGRELWRSDGTTEGTTLVKDIVVGAASSSPVNLTEFQGKLYFYAFDGVNNFNLWVSDGTDGGTYMLKEISATGSHGQVNKLLATDYLLFFTADDAVHGLELWVSDGTESGTYMVRDIAEGVDSEAWNLVNLQDIVYFEYYEGDRRLLWRSDGTSDGTYQVYDFGEGFFHIYHEGEKIYVETQEDGQDLLWVSDGTSAGTSVLPQLYEEEYYFGTFQQVGSELYFWARPRSYKFPALWKFNPNDSSLQEVTDLNTDKYPEVTYGIFDTYSINGKYVFNLDHKLWFSDGTEEGTRLLKELGRTAE